MRGNHGDAAEALRSVLTEIIEPVVVGSTDSRRERWVQAIKAHDIEPDGGAQCRQIDPFTIHCRDLGDGIKAAGGVGLEVWPHYAEHPIPALSGMGVHGG